VEINAMADSVGVVKLIKHTGTHLENAIVDDVLSNTNTGTTCILTNTNQEALNVLGVLHRRGVNAKLIQSNDSFDIYHIAELRFFTKKLQSLGNTPTISEERWNFAISELKKYYANSECLPLVLDILKVFSDNHPHKYRLDFEMYLHESKLENFYQQEDGVITVSTMHKSKGREFDNVYMLSSPTLKDDSEKRKLYVAITRAKSKLHIHYTGNALDKYKSYATAYFVDSTIYPKPNEVTIQLSHKDVNLSFFKDKKNQILKLRSGYPLEVNLKNNTLCFNNFNKLYPLVKFSKKFTEELRKLIGNGYSPNYANVRFIVAWKGKEDTVESAIILPNITFRLNQ
jgi:ATP-dependent DNA helicase RecQ